MRARAMRRAAGGATAAGGPAGRLTGGAAGGAGAVDAGASDAADGGVVDGGGAADAATDGAVDGGDAADVAADAREFPRVDPATVGPMRLIAPLSTTIVTSRRPTLRWRSVPDG